MKAITLWQPWASLVAVGAKTFETRHWPISHRGTIAIHAASRHPHDFLRILDEETIDAMSDALNGVSFGDLPRGQIVATAELAGCFKIHRKLHSSIPIIFKQRPNCGIATVEIPALERPFGDFSPGRYAWELARVQRLDAPIAARGRQGLWEWREAS